MRCARLYIIVPPGIKIESDWSIRNGEDGKEQTVERYKRFGESGFQTDDDKSLFG